MKSIEVFFLLFLCYQQLLAQAPRECSFKLWQGECVAFSNCAYAVNKQLSEFLTPEAFQDITDRGKACEKHGKGSGLCCEKSGILPSKPTPAVVHVQVPESTTAIASTPRPPVVNLLAHPNYKLFKTLKCGVSDPSDRIAFGENATMNEFPWAARLGYDSLGETDFDCAGTVISEFYVLTAAHCLVALPKNKKLKTVRLGEWNTLTEKDCVYDEDEEEETCTGPVQDIAVKSFVPHPEYSRETIHNDIGLVQLSQKAKFGQKNIKPICLPFAPEALIIPDDFLVIGWGRTQNTSGSTILQKASLKFFSQQKCEEKFSKNKLVLGDGQFCAGGMGKVDACKGDSGSSILSQVSINGKPKMVQYGIVSFGVASCGVLEGFPGIYTKVLPYLPWMLDNTVANT